ncbi:unnamed protein product, partial [Porites lobata]
NPRKAYTVSAPQEEKQSKNLTSCGPKTTWKAAARGGSRKFRKGWLGHLPTCQVCRNSTKEKTWSLQG